MRARPRRGGFRGRLTLADVGVAQVPVGVLVVEGGALLALPPDGVVLAVVAHAAAHVARRHVHGQVEVARRGVLVALAPCGEERGVYSSMLVRWLKFVFLNTESCRSQGSH